MALKVRNIMTENPICVDQGTNLMIVLDIMTEHGFTCLPVVSSRKKQIRGMVTGKEVLDFVAHINSEQKLYHLALVTLVDELMVEDPNTLSPDDDIFTAARLMDKLNLDHLPVVERNQLIGVISQGDLLQAIASAIKEIEKTESEDRKKIRTLGAIILTDAEEKLQILLALEKTSNKWTLPKFTLQEIDDEAHINILKLLESKGLDVRKIVPIDYETEETQFFCCVTSKVEVLGLADTYTKTKWYEVYEEAPKELGQYNDRALLNLAANMFNQLDT